MGPGRGWRVAREWVVCQDIRVQSLYDFPEIYDAFHADVTEDLGYFRRLARCSGGPVIEAGCGTGRVASVLVQDGCTVFGIDRSEVLLARASDTIRRALAGSDAPGRFEAIHGDVRECAAPASAALVILPLHFCAHVHSMPELEDLLRRVRRACVPGGRVALHGFVRGAGVAADGELVHRKTVRVGAEGESEWYETRVLSGDIEELVWYLQTPRDDYTFELKLRIWSVDQYVQAAAAAGLVPDKSWSQVDDENMFLCFSCTSPE